MLILALPVGLTTPAGQSLFSRPNHIPSQTQQRAPRPCVRASPRHRAHLGTSMTRQPAPHQKMRARNTDFPVGLTTKEDEVDERRGGGGEVCSSRHYQ